MCYATCLDTRVTLPWCVSLNSPETGFQVASASQELRIGGEAVRHELQVYLWGLQC